MSVEQYSYVFAALSLVGRFAALICALMAGAKFQKASDTNDVSDMVKGLAFLATAFACSGVSIALSGGR